MLFYHYTPSPGLDSIVRHKALWLSDSENLNDYKEGLLFDEIVDHNLGDLIRSKGHALPDLAELSSAIRQKIADLFNYKAYICCFTENGDALSQWRGYADDGHGAAIGFDPAALRDLVGGQSEVFLTDVEYIGRDSPLSKIEDDSVDAILDKFVEHALNGQTLKFESNAGARHNAVKVRWKFKLHYFEEEREHRIIYTPEPGTQSRPGFLSERRFRFARASLIDYFELGFPAAAIREIVLGPKNAFCLADFEDYLALHGLGHVVVRKSGATYR
ncbi:DUF2971 family protein [Crenobacter luteus]|uniref:DUF2971 domain-containing protein n=1 Tax=Crenobacter luteus TaxID=1452487 RepID=UPI00104BE7FA|nr:DUF2971 domain-containing protein [Crenobacter luteus]TCP15234.1 DUF2971 family protein [Crenobacter luteus]